MTRENVTSIQGTRPAFYFNLQTHPLYIDLTPDIEPIDPSGFSRKIGGSNLRERRWHQIRNRCFDRVLSKLSDKDIPGKCHVEAYLRDQYRRHLSYNTVRHSFTTIGSFVGFIAQGGKEHLEEIRREDLEGWIEHEQDRGLKSTTVRTRIGSLKAFLRFLAGKDVVDSEVLCRRVMIKVPDALPRAMDPDDVRRLLSVIDHVRNRAMIVVLLRTAMRIGELLNTLVEDVNLKERKIEIYESEKSRVGRVVYLSEDAVGALEAWFKESEPHKEFLFYARGRHTMSYQNARVMFHKYVRRAGLSRKGYTLHCLRHTCASELLNAGMRLECVQQLLGHSSIEMTRRYARLTDRTREEEYFKAMSKIERGEIDGHYRVDRELQALHEEKELLASHDQELHEQP